VQQDGLLGAGVVFHRLVSVEVVWPQVQHDAHGGAEAGGLEAFELEAGELQHHEVAGADAVEFFEQRAADVAAEPCAARPGRQQVCGEAGGGGLAVAAGHSDNSCGAELEEEVYLGLQRHAGPPRHGEVGRIVRHRGIDHHHIGVREVRVVVPAEVAGDRQPVERGERGGEGRGVLQVGGRHAGAPSCEEAGHAHPAAEEADAHHRHALACQVGRAHLSPRLRLGNVAGEHPQYSQKRRRVNSSFSPAP